MKPSIRTALLAAVVTLSIQGCASSPSTSSPSAASGAAGDGKAAPPAQAHDAQPPNLQPHNVQPPNPDPWESFNRKIFAFNDFADRWFLKPVAKGYQWITPQFLEDGIDRMFNNLGEVGSIVNSLLQAKFKNTAVDSGRLVVNSTVGLLGFFDVAGKMGLEDHNEDFGQTLGYWGVGSGPYIVVPFFGPRTIRSGFGSIADVYTDPVGYIQHVPTRNELYAGRVVDQRAQLLSAEGLITGDRYIFIRDAYLQRRQFLVNDGAVKDPFGGEDDFGGDNY